MQRKKIFQTTLFVALGALVLSACGPVYQTSYRYISPKHWRGKQCVNRCLRSRTYCESQCRTSNQSCRNIADLAAMPPYLAYVEQAKKNDQPVWKKVSDFADYSQCNSDCGCMDTYRQCFSECGGKVIATTYCTSFCKHAAPPSTTVLHY